jgi:hypothetical protein
VTPEAQEHLRQNITPSDDCFLATIGVRSKPLACDVKCTDETLILRRFLSALRCAIRRFMWDQNY